MYVVYALFDGPEPMSIMSSLTGIHELKISKNEEVMKLKVGVWDKLKWEIEKYLL